MFQFQYFKIPRILSRDYCLRALHALEKGVKRSQKGFINLVVVSPEEMAQMNKQFRGKEGPTDILTFSYLQQMKNEKGKMKNGGITSVHLHGNGAEVAGEIYLCLEKIKLYAKEAEKTYKEQLEYVIIHGLVHLMGYDHENETDWKEMEKVEKKIQMLLK